jgi:hypothetical protein
MAYKLRISKSGYNVLTETNLNNIIFDSDYNTLKYHSSGSVNLTASGSDVSTSIAHNLGYVPFFIVYCFGFISTSYAMCPFYFADVGYYAHISAYADSTNIYFTIQTNSYTGTMTFLYKIFRNNTGL